MTGQMPAEPLPVRQTGGGTRRMAVALTIVAVIVVAAVVVPGYLLSRSEASPPPTHAWVIVMENREEKSIVGSRNAPYLNSLIATYGFANQYHAIVHGSQPNYIALFSGGLQGVSGNQLVSLHARNLADQIEAAGKSWRVFAQNVPPNCFTGETATGGADGPGTYARKHEPAISFADISSNPARCANIQDLSHFDPMAADFELIVPNLENDMHNGTTLEGDTFLRGFLPRIMASAAWQAGSPIFITWDEGSQQGDNRIATLVVAHGMRAGYRSNVPHTHYSLLRTVEWLLGLPCLGQACHANTLSEFFPKLPAPSLAPTP